MSENGIEPTHTDGMGEGKWAVLDYGGVIVHIFNDETRMFYCLENFGRTVKMSQSTMAEK